MTVMTAPQAAAAATSSPAAPAPTPPALSSGQVRQRRRPWLAMLGVMLIALFGLAGAWLATSGRDQVSVVVSAAPLTPGNPVTLADLATVSISDTAAGSVVPAQEMASLVGRYPIGALPAGAILAPGALTERVTPAAGESIIAVGLTPTQLPAIGLAPGDVVVLVMAYTSVGAPIEGGPTPGQTWPATVAAVGTGRDDGSVTVDFTLDSAAALQAAAAAGTGSLTVVLTSTIDGR